MGSPLSSLPHPLHTEQMRCRWAADTQSHTIDTANINCADSCEGFPVTSILWHCACFCFLVGAILAAACNLAHPHLACMAVFCAACPELTARSSHLGSCSYQMCTVLIRWHPYISLVPYRRVLWQYFGNCRPATGQLMSSRPQCLSGRRSSTRAGRCGRRMRSAEGQQHSSDESAVQRLNTCGHA